MPFTGGGGVGRMLVEALLEESRRRNAYRVYLELPSRMSASTGLVVLSDPVSACVGEVAIDDWTVL